MAVGVESHALVRRTGGRCTEVRRSCITTPIVTLLITIARVTGNKEAGVERSIADQQLVGESAARSHTVPQSIGIGTLSIVTSGRYGYLGATFEVGLVSSLVINEDDFCELKQWKRRLNGKEVFQRTLTATTFSVCNIYIFVAFKIIQFILSCTTAGL